MIEHWFSSCDSKAEKKRLIDEYQIIQRIAKLMCQINHEMNACSNKNVKNMPIEWNFINECRETYCVMIDMIGALLHGMQQAMKPKKLEKMEKKLKKQLQNHNIFSMAFSALSQQPFNNRCIFSFTKIISWFCPMLMSRKDIFDHFSQNTDQLTILCYTIENFESILLQTGLHKSHTYTQPIIRCDVLFNLCFAIGNVLGNRIGVDIPSSEIVSLYLDKQLQTCTKLEKFLHFLVLNFFSGTNSRIMPTSATYYTRMVKQQNPTTEYNSVDNFLDTIIYDNTRICSRIDCEKCKHDSVVELSTPQTDSYFRHGNDKDLAFQYSLEFSKTQQLCEYGRIFMGNMTQNYELSHTNDFTFGMNNLFYGIDFYGIDIGYYGVIPLIFSHLYHSFDYNDQHKWPSHDNSVAAGDRHIVRFIRTSLTMFANSINKDRIVSGKLGDEQFWQALSLIMIGKYSFRYGNFQLLDTSTYKIGPYDNRTYSYEGEIVCSIHMVQDYIIQYVIKPIETGIELLESFQSKSKYCNDEYEFMRQIHMILRFCSCIVGDRKKFMLYEDLSTTSCDRKRLCELQQENKNQDSSYMNQKKLEYTWLDCMEDTRSGYSGKLSSRDKCIYHIISLRLSKDMSEMMNLLINHLKEFKFGRFKEYFFPVESPSMLKHLDQQFSEWKSNIGDTTSRNNNLYQKWKNCTCIKFCNYCKNNSIKLKKCKQCNKVYYCSKLCQKRDWKFGNHKLNCL